MSDTVENTQPTEENSAPEGHPEQPAESHPESSLDTHGDSSPEAFPEDFPLPPPTFDFLVASVRAQAEMQLGLFHFGPENERPKPNLKLARHSIDMLGVLHEKTRGNLSLEESRMLENSLTELRFRFVQAAESKK